MTQVPEAITARLQEIEDRLAEAREKQNEDSLGLAVLTQGEAQIRERIAARRREMRDWKMQRKVLCYAVDAIEGRVIHFGTVGAPIEPVTIERVVMQGPPPWMESGAASPHKEQVEPRSEPRQLKEEAGPSTKETVYATMRKLGPALPRQIAAEAGFLGGGRCVGAILGLLRKEGKAIRTEEGMWGPAHQ